MALLKIYRYSRTLSSGFFLMNCEVNNLTDLIEKLKDTNNFSNTEQVIADFIMKNFQKLAKLSTRQLAKETFTSSAAIVRFSQKLGFGGYTDFKIKFLAEMAERNNELREKFIKPQDSIATIIEKVAQIEISALKETQEKIKVTPFVRAINYLSQAEHIDFYAMNNNLNIARMAAESFIMAEKYSSIHSSLSTQYLQAYIAPKNHVAFFISRTGENKLLIEIAKVLQERQSTIFLITAAPKSTLANLSKVVFETATSDKIEELGPRVFLTGAKYVIDVLFALLMVRLDEVKSRRKDEWLKKICIIDSPENIL